MTGIAWAAISPARRRLGPRFAAGAVWGATTTGRSAAQAHEARRRNPVPHYWAHVIWAFGAAT